METQIYQTLRPNQNIPIIPKAMMPIWRQELYCKPFNKDTAREKTLPLSQSNSLDQHTAPVLDILVSQQN